MVLGYKVYPDATTARAQADAVWDRYSARERTARSLPAGASLDLRAGVRVEPPITVRYETVVTASGETRACVAVDDFIASLHGQTIRGIVMDTIGYVDIGSLPPRLRDAVRPPGGPAITTSRVR